LFCGVNLSPAHLKFLLYHQGNGPDAFPSGQTQWHFTNEQRFEFLRMQRLAFTSIGVRLHPLDKTENETENGRHNQKVGVTTPTRNSGVLIAVSEFVEWARSQKFKVPAPFAERFPIVQLGSLSPPAEKAPVTSLAPEDALLVGGKNILKLLEANNALPRIRKGREGQSPSWDTWVRELTLHHARWEPPRRAGERAKMIRLSELRRATGLALLNVPKQ
jgi:hypothetical protein